MATEGYLALSQGITQFGSAYSQGRAAESQYKFQAQQIEANVRLAELNAEDSVRRGKVAADKMRKTTQEVVSAQRADFAGQNIAVDEGTALALQNETIAQGTENALTIENNAWREAWGYKVQAVSGQGQASMSRLAAGNVMGNTVLTGGLNAVNLGAQTYYNSKKQTAKSTGEE